MFNEDWTAREEKGAHRLRARTAVGELTLTLQPAKTPVLHGEGGISKKGPGPNEYSRYVSMTRLAATGRSTRTEAAARL